MFEDAETWSNDWAWSLPLIVLTVLAHAFGLALIREQLVLPAGGGLGELVHGGPSPFPAVTGLFLCSYCRQGARAVPLRGGAQERHRIRLGVWRSRLG